MLIGKKIWAILLFSAFLAGCSGNKREQPKIPDQPASELYAQAQKQLNAGSYLNASETLEALDTRYPFGPYSTQVQLDLIYAYYKQGETAKAQANIDRFLRNNPTHQSLDYVYYMRGLSHMAADYSFFQSIMRVDRYDRDPSFAQDAFSDFRLLINRYPDSVYASDARRRMIYLKYNLARHELAVARYYVKRDAPLAAINRCRYIIETFPDTESARDALRIMENSYRTLGLNDLADQAAKVARSNS
ncbi:outer membrane protein assembly factor BamD [Alginatibacterium sediminis]|uniref:Outer membrane protein assembly factor BamD n=1 Tax=Alginatibacterium sediminis TaxID=2164068 RepID=A0A420EJN7_9ALTE|nr:outer membrane protein assembly factor BamD [Alginatibacterium sediminis]RKF20932.1 outer membrane protein assembly factor BamD [Alginatibacterium sediminis]